MKTVTKARAGALAIKRRLKVAPALTGNTAINAPVERLFKIAIARTLQLIVAVMIMSGLCPPLARAQGLPAQNKAIYLGWGGYVDTQADFSLFFNSDHTLMTWFMPQYLYAYRGPIFANSGDGTYIFGMEDYRMGDGGLKDEGNPVMVLQVGNQQKLFLVPGLTRDQWHHLAVVRTDTVIKVYMDGAKLQPVKIIDKEANMIVPDIDLAVSGVDSPKGTLRFGRKDAGHDTSTQLYGLLDDVAVFDRALSEIEIDSIRNHKRLTGSENGLLLGWAFDQPKKSDPPLSPFLNATAHLNSRVTRITVTPDRFDLVDGVAYYAQSLLGTVAESVRLPFKANEVWKVIQGFDSPGVSHNGFASFCYDLGLAQSSGDKIYPNGSIYAPIYSGSNGYLANYTKDDVPIDGDQEENVVFIMTTTNEFLSYRHNAPYSINTDLDTGTCTPGQGCSFPSAFGPKVQQGDFLAKVGVNAAHLHFGGCNDPIKSTRVTFPVAFDNYEMSTDQGATWTHITRGYPTQGQWIKRL
jgi:Concanavalin A-like lectin/glucanases superfamily